MSNVVNDSSIVLAAVDLGIRYCLEAHPGLSSKVCVEKVDEALRTSVFGHKTSSPAPLPNLIRHRLAHLIGVGDVVQVKSDLFLTTEGVAGAQSIERMMSALKTLR